MQRKLLMILENIFYVFSILISIIFLFLSIVATIENLINGNSDFDNVMAMTSIFTINSVIASFIHNIKIKRKDRAIKLCEDFEREDYRDARKLTRSIRDIDKKGEIPPVVLEGLINNVKNKKVNKLRKRCGLTEEEQSKLQESIIFIFNYWERIYYELKDGVADEEYLNEQLMGVFIGQYKRFEYWLENYLNDNCLEQLEHLQELYSYAQNKTKNYHLTFSQKLHNFFCGLC